jgi:hypothetical protein
VLAAGFGFWTQQHKLALEYDSLCSISTFVNIILAFECNIEPIERYRVKVFSQHSPTPRSE